MPLSNTQILLLKPRSDLTLEQLNELVTWLLNLNVWADAAYDMGAPETNRKSVRWLISAALFEPEVWATMNEKYIDYVPFSMQEMKVCKPIIACAPQFLQERLEEIFWFMTQMVAVKLEDEQRNRVKMNAAYNGSNDWQTNMYPSGYGM